MKKIAMFITDQCWSGNSSLIIELLNTALEFQKRQNQRPAFSIDLVGINALPVKTFSGQLLQSQYDINQHAQQYDCVCLPNIWEIDDQKLSRNASIYPWLRQQYQAGASIYGFVTGAYLMAEAGLLNGRTATTHWHLAEDFQRRYPKVNLSPDEMLTSHQRLYCCGGINATMDMSMHIIQEYCGPIVAQQCEKHCMMGTRRNYLRVNIDVSQYKTHSDERILGIQTWLEKHYAEPISLEEVATQFGFSQRNLNRRFKLAVNQAPQKYLQLYRMEVAKELLRNSSLSIQQVCYDCGYDSITVFGRRFKQYAQMSPSEFKRKHNC